MAISALQRRRLEEQAKLQRQAQQSNKPPAVGSKRADGKVYSGQNYGYQSAGSHNKLKQDGKFKHGAQALDRVTQTVSRAIPQPIKDYAQGVVAEGARQQQVKDRLLNRAGIDTSKPDATQRTLQGISNKTNVDRRIVDTAAALAQSAISARALKVNKPSVAAPNRSVGAAAAPAPTRRELPRVNRPGTIKATRAKPSAPVQPAVSQPKAPTRQVNLGNIQRGPKKFTPGTRAQAVQRANSRALNTPGYQARRNNAIGIDARRTIRPNGDNTRTHDIAFSNSDQKLNARGRNDAYGSRRDIGETPKSKATERLRRSGLKDMMGRMLDINQFDTATASPTTQSRGILYNRASKGALSTRRGDRNARSTRVGPNMWINHEDGNKRVKFDPKSLTEALTKQTKTQATRVGRAVGGTSKKPALIERPKNTIRNPKAQATKAKPGTAARKRAKVRQISEARSWVAQQERRRARREANPPNGNTIRERQGVVRSNRRSRVSAAQRAFERSASIEANWNALFTRVRTAAEQAAARRFINQRVGGREVDRGGRRTWNGTHETRRLRTRGRQ
jgi:hypothetical protein